MEILKTFDFEQSPVEVYAAWVSSATVIPPAVEMDVNPEVGGHYILVAKGPDFTARNEGRFLEVEPGRRVRYTWQWDHDPEVTEIEVSFEAKAGGTKLTLAHTGFQSEDSRANHDGGWDSYCTGLKALLNGE